MDGSRYVNEASPESNSAVFSHALGSGESVGERELGVKCLEHRAFSAVSLIKSGLNPPNHNYLDR